MSNQDILKALKENRDVANFARFINMSRQGLIKKLASKRTQDNQYYNFNMFVIAKYKEEL